MTAIPLRVLVVDDDELVRMATHHALSDAGHVVTQAEDGARALELIREHAFDVAICDVRLPKVDGMTLFRTIRRQAPDTAVIVITSHAEVKDALECLQEGASDYLTKPVHSAPLLRRMQRIGARIAARKQRTEVGAKG